MRTLSVLACLIVPAFAVAQTPELVAKTNATLYILRLQDPTTGAFKVTPDGQPSLRACNGGLKGLKYLGYDKPIPHVDKIKAFILSCYDPKTGAFAEPGGKPDVTITSIGVMAALEAGIPKEKIAKSMDYLKENAKSFDDVRIGAAAVEAWGVKDCPFDLEAWFAVARRITLPERTNRPTGYGRELGSAVALWLRLGKPYSPSNTMPATLPGSQWPDGGWGKSGAAKSDLESTYRVVRALMLMKTRPADSVKLRSYLLSCGNKDGGFGVVPGDASTLSGTYYFAAITKWLDEMK